MSTDDGGAARPGDPGAPARAYNRPRRYPVQAPVTQTQPDAAPPAPAGEVTRQNPSFAEAAEDHARRHGSAPPSVERDGPSGPADVGAPGGPATSGYGSAAPGPPAPGPSPLAPPPGGPPTAGPPPPPSAGYPPAGNGSPPPAGRRTPSRRSLLVAAAVVVVLAVVIALVVAFSGDDDSAKQPRSGGPASTATATPSAAATTATGAEGASGTGAAPPVDETPATEICANLGSTPPLTTFVAQPRPAERMPESYVEPPSGEKIAVCVGLFRSGAGAGRGRIAYLAEYERLAATQYAAALKTLGWVVVPGLPSPTYRNNFDTTVTLVQQGTALVTVVGTGR